MSELDATLLILAAGMGSRYGGLKQLDPMGPSGEVLLDYSVHDAIQAGFNKLVFGIRKDIATAFQETIGQRYADKISLQYVYQELDDIPSPHSIPQGRTKPWGTGHALRAARDVIKGPFAIINADDFYGADAYRVMIQYFTDCRAQAKKPFCMIGYPLANTLTEHGGVNRGLCEASDGQLASVQEITNIHQTPEGGIIGHTSADEAITIYPDVLVSMNFWGFSEAIFPPLERHFLEFLNQNGNQLKSEFYIPTFVDTLIAKENASCDLLQTTAQWFGVTYPDDKPVVQSQLAKLHQSAHYPSSLD